MPSITIWSRIETRARTGDMEAGLEARVFDPLWLLARQWQVGEFAGRDAGSPVNAQVASSAAAFDRYAAGAEAPRALDNRLPLEVLVEREAIRPAVATGDLRQTVEAGLQFFRMLDQAGLSRLRAAYVAQYPIPAIPALDADGQRLLAAVTGRIPDGIRLHADLLHAGAALPALPAIAAADKAAVLKIAQAFVSLFGALVSEPANADTWSPDRMEYSFAIGAGASGKLAAEEYDGGSADWHTFHRSAAALAGTTATPVTATRNVMPSPVTFRGAPARRFWEFEDAAVDVGALTAAAEDVGRLLLREFALIYGNDWFQIPLAVSAGSEVTVTALTVADTFGVNTPIPHYTDADGAAGAWRMFAVSADTPAASAASAHVLVVPPNAVAAVDGAAIEDVLLLRDELANMAWGVESSAVGPSGAIVDRAQVYRTNAPAAVPPAQGSMPQYRLGSTVPDYWIPFLPVSVGSGPLRLRLGKLPTAPTGPMGRLLSYPALTMYLEELPREGVHLQRRYRQARGPDGSTYVWIGRLRYTGRGEDRSGLEFDYVQY